MNSKKRATSKHLIAESIASLATAEGGRIYIGVRPDKTVEGIEGLESGKSRDAKQRQILDVTKQIVKPSIRVKVHFIPIDLIRTIIRIDVPKGDEPVYFADYQPYIRDLSSNRKLDPLEVKHIYYKQFQKEKHRASKTVLEKTSAVSGEKAKLRREHSLKIIEEALKPWLNKSLEYCKLDAEYSPRIEKIAGLEPKDPTDLDFFDVARSHLKSKYPEVIRTWDELKRITSEHNSKLAILLNELKEFLTSFIQVRSIYSEFRGKVPAQHMYVDWFVKLVYEEIKGRVLNEIEYFIDEPRIQNFVDGSLWFYVLEWKNRRLITSRNESEVKHAIVIINKMLEAPKFREETRELLKMENELFKLKLLNFETEIKDVIKSVEPGNPLKGKCRHCP